MERNRSRRNQTTAGRPQSPHLLKSRSEAVNIPSTPPQGRNQTAVGRPQSPHQLRSRSAAINIPSTPPPDFPPLTPLSVRSKSTISRSKSTTKARTISRGEENNNLVGFSQRYQRISDLTGKTNELVKTKQKSRSASSSPSAWALSPGRIPTAPMVMNLDRSTLPINKVKPAANAASAAAAGGGAKVKSSGGGAVGGVLKYFRSKKVSPIQEEAFHRFRILHTRLVQWRVVNARAEFAMFNQNVVAKEKLFNVWLRIYKLRNSVAEKKFIIQKLKHEIKVLQIINSQIRLLNEWNKIEKRNFEAVTKLSRNLSVVSVKLPLIKGAKADTMSVYRAMYTAVNVMSDIEETMDKSFFQVEETLFMLNELMETTRLEAESLEELRMTIAMVASLEVQERCLRVYLIQAAKEGLATSANTWS